MASGGILVILNRTSVVAEPPELLAQILWLVHVCNKDELPDIDPVFESKEKPSGRLGLISHVEGVPPSMDGSTMPVSSPILRSNSEGS